MNRRFARKPLVEALVELKWRLKALGPKQAQDPAYPLYVGRFFESVKASFPSFVKLPAADFPDLITPHVAKYQFRRAVGEWPVIQCGPGIATLNFNQDYDWERFRKSAVEFHSKLLESHRVESVSDPPEFETILLRYINAVDKEPDLVSFLEQKLHTRIQLPDNVAKAPHVDPSLQSVNLRLVYSLPDIEAKGLIQIADGAKDGKPSFIFEFQVVTDKAPQNNDGFEKWLIAAHETIEAWFLAFIRGELERRFEPMHDAASA